MNRARQSQKAQILLSLHRNGKLLILPNIWDPIGARILEAQGYPAIATASSAISASLGYVDGEKIKLSTLIHTISRIAASVDVQSLPTLSLAMRKTFRSWKKRSYE
jgi:2-methylisocitrate lyase-like PEP mutase family enzyme